MIGTSGSFSFLVDFLGFLGSGVSGIGLIAEDFRLSDFFFAFLGVTMRFLGVFLGVSEMEESENFRKIEKFFNYFENNQFFGKLS